MDSAQAVSSWISVGYHHANKFCVCVFVHGHTHTLAIMFMVEICLYSDHIHDAAIVAKDKNLNYLLYCLLVSRFTILSVMLIPCQPLESRLCQLFRIFHCCPNKSQTVVLMLQPLLVQLLLF